MADITVEELKKRMDSGESLNMIDVREEWEYEEFNIGATLVPLATLPLRIDEFSSLRDKEVIVHCRSGARSKNAQSILQKNGFSNVRNLIGGMTEWCEKFE